MSPILRAALIRERLDPKAVLAILSPPASVGASSNNVILVGHATDTDPFWSIWIKGPDAFRPTGVGSRDGCQLVSLLDRPAGHA